MRFVQLLLLSTALIGLAERAALADGLGGCCQFDGSCLNDVTEAACMAGSDLNFWIKGLPCGLAGGFTCHPRIGACCNGTDCQSPISILECQCPQCSFTSGGHCAANPCAIPTMSEWGLIVMTLVLLTGAKVYHRTI
jgi:hypothetical protein